MVGGSFCWPDGLVTPGGPYLRVVVPRWLGKETREPQTPHPALGAPSSNVLRARSSDPRRRGRHAEGLLLHLSYLLFCYRATATNTKLTGVRTGAPTPREHVVTAEALKVSCVLGVVPLSVTSVTFV